MHKLLLLHYISFIRKNQYQKHEFDTSGDMIHHDAASQASPFHQKIKKICEFVSDDAAVWLPFDQEPKQGFLFSTYGWVNAGKSH